MKKLEFFWEFPEFKYKDILKKIIANKDFKEVSYKQIYVNSLIFLLIAKKNKYTFKTLFSKSEKPCNCNLCTNIILIIKEFFKELTKISKSLEPFWKPSYKEISEKLVTSDKIDILDFDSSSLKNPKNLSNKESLGELWSTFKFSSKGNWEKEVSGKSKNIRALKIPLKPTPVQQKILLDWVHCSRTLRNKVVSYLNENGLKDNMDWFKLRNKFVTYKTRKGIVNSEISEFERKVPSYLRALVIKNFISNVNASLTNLRNGNITHFSLNYQSKKYTKSYSLELKKSLVNFSKKEGTFKFYSTFFPEDSNSFKVGKRFMKNCKNLYDGSYDSKLHYDCVHKKWSLIILNDSSERTKVHEKIKMAAIDPGVKTFATVYDSEGNSWKAELPREKIKKLQRKIACLQSLRKTQKSINKYHRKINNTVKNFHHKLSIFLSDNYELVVLPPFESQELRAKSGNHGYNNILLNVNRHYQFSQLLSYKLNQKVSRIGEAWTSKTCSSCGNIKNDLNLEMRTYECTSCFISLDRDVNAAKNILMKTIASGI